MGDNQIRLFELLYLSLPEPLGTDLTPPCLMNSDLHQSTTGWHHPGTHKFRSWELIKKKTKPKPKHLFLSFTDGTTVESSLAARHQCHH